MSPSWTIFFGLLCFSCGLFLGWACTIIWHDREIARSADREVLRLTSRALRHLLGGGAVGRG